MSDQSLRNGLRSSALAQGKGKWPAVHAHTLLTLRNSWATQVQAVTQRACAPWQTLLYHAQTHSFTAPKATWRSAIAPACPSKTRALGATPDTRHGNDRHACCPHRQACLSLPSTPIWSIAYLAPGIADPLFAKLHNLRYVVLCIKLPVRVHLVRLLLLLCRLLGVLGGKPEAQLRQTRPVQEFSTGRAAQGSQADYQPLLDFAHVPTSLLSSRDLQ